jgi:prepilin-type N-terminal cleavage/methylation domain-containing protein
MTSETRDSAFTLIEILLVVAIIGLAAAIAAPLMAGSSRGLAGRAAAYEMLSLLRQARWYAVDAELSCIVSVSPAENGYRWEVFRAPPGSDDLTTVDAEWAQPGLLEKIDGLMRIPPDSRLQSAHAMDIRLEPWGVDADYLIDLGGPHSMRIEVRRPSGMVWLLDDQAGESLGGEGLSAAEAYWEANCSVPTQ